MSRDQQLKEIKEAQTAVVTANKVCEEITAKLTEIEGEQSAAHQAEKDIPKLNRQKQALQADRAMGVEVKQSDIDQIDKDIAKVTEAVKFHDQTVTGLRAKLSTSQTALKTNEDALLIKKRVLIENEAESLHVEYMKNAETLLSTFRRLVALDRISRGLGGNPLSSGQPHTDICIPVFNFASSGQWPPQLGDPGCHWIPAAEMSRPELYMHADEEAERARLAGIGVQI